MNVLKIGGQWLTSSSLMALVVAFTFLCGGLAYGQDSAKSMLQLAGKTANQARGKNSNEKAKIYREALVAYAKVVEGWPESLKEKARAHVEAGKLYRKLGEADQALQSYESALAIPGQVKAHVMALQSMASLHRKQKDLAAVRADYERLVKDCALEERSCAQARLSLATLARRAHQWKGSDQLAQSVLDDTPHLWRENVDACNALVSSLVKRREWVKALKALASQDEFLRERFGQTDLWGKVQKLMSKMSARRSLTPITEGD